MLVLIGDGMQSYAKLASEQKIRCIAFHPSPPCGYPEDTICVSKESELYEAVVSLACEADTLEFAKNPNSDIGDADFEQIDQKCDRLFYQAKMADSVLDKYLPLWQKNACENILARIERPLVSDVSFKGVPAVVVAPGPSLEKNVHKLAKLKGKAVIVALQRAAKQMMEASVEPDAIIALDAQDFVFDHFAGMSLDRATLILEQSVCPDIFKIPVRNILTYEGHGEYFSWYNELFNSSVHIPPMTTVACAAFNLVKLWQCDPVVAVGLDLAHNGDRYSNGNQREEHLRFTVRDCDGNVLRSEQDLVVTKDWIENIILDNPGVYYNCTEGGAKIEGMLHGPLDDFLEIICLNSVSPMAVFDSARSSNKLREVTKRVRRAIDKGKIPKEFQEILVRTLRR